MTLCWIEPKVLPNRYVVQLLHDSEVIQSSSTSQPEFFQKYKGLLAAEEYGFQVAALNHSGQGKWSDIVRFKTG